MCPKEGKKEKIMQSNQRKALIEQKSNDLENIEKKVGLRKKTRSSTIFNDAVVGISANSKAKLQLAIYILESKIKSSKGICQRKGKKKKMQQLSKIRL